MTAWTHLPEPFRSALCSGDIAALQGLLDAGLDVNERLAGGLTPLMVAVEAADPHAVRWLLASGADPMAADDLGYSVEAHARYDFGRRVRGRPEVRTVADLIERAVREA